jgi:hypothetical protein
MVGIIEAVRSGVQFILSRALRPPFVGKPYQRAEKLRKKRLPRVFKKHVRYVFIPFPYHLALQTPVHFYTHSDSNDYIMR